MNEFVFTLAILINKKVITEAEAKKLIKESSTGILNSNLKEMVAKVEKGLKVETAEIEKIDAKEFFKS